MPVGVTVLGKNRWRYYQEKIHLLLIEGIWGANDITQRMGNIVTLTINYFSGPRSQQSHKMALATPGPRI